MITCKCQVFFKVAFYILGRRMNYLLIFNFYTMKKDKTGVIERLRAVLGMTQGEFANAVGCSLVTISFLETFKHPPSRLTASAICRIARKNGISLHPSQIMDDYVEIMFKS